ncbi:MAG: sodium-dependent transporter, partial [Planctomycetota bacterium]
FGIVVYYAVVIAWCLCYFVASFTLAWGADPTKFFADFIVSSETVYDEETGRFVLGKMNWWGVLALAVVWLANWVITFFGIRKGIERASKVFIPLLVVLVAVLVGWSLTFAGAQDGVRYYLKPDWSVLAKPGVWTEAFTQIFFTLSLGFGIMIAYASYLPRESDIPVDAFLTSVGNCGFSIFAGFAVFATLGHIAAAQGTTVEGLETKLSGPGLIFVTYPVALNKIAGGQFFGVLFFLVLVVAGLSSSMSIVEAFTTAVLDRFQVARRVVVSLLCGVAFLMGLVFATGSGLFVLDIVDHFLLTYGLMTVAILECLIVGWFFSAKRLRAHLDDTAGLRFGPVTGFLMRGVITAVLVVTWYGMATQAPETIGASIVRFLLLGGILLVWLDEHWLDADIKLVIPVLLVLLLDRALLTDITEPYEGYPAPALLWLGLGWIVVTLVIAFVLNALFRLEEPSGTEEVD